MSRTQQHITVTSGPGQHSHYIKITLIRTQQCHEHNSTTSLWHQYQDNIHTKPKSLWCDINNVTNTSQLHRITVAPISGFNNNSHHNKITLIGSHQCHEHHSTTSLLNDITPLAPTPVQHSHQTKITLIRAQQCHEHSSTTLLWH